MYKCIRLSWQVGSERYVLGETGLEARPASHRRARAPSASRPIASNNFSVFIILYMIKTEIHICFNHVSVFIFKDNNHE